MREKGGQQRDELVVGVTGHRFLVRVHEIAAGVNEALRRIEAAFPDRPLAVISPLAEGADRLVAERALTRGRARLIVPLPLPVDDYLKDFASPASKEAFRALLARADEVIELPLAASRNAAYESVGQYVLDHCNLLVAVWDGRAARGRGGTAQVVALARRRGLPLIRISAINHRPDSPHPVDLEQGILELERFPPA
jgi:hypothetical protein